MENHKQIKKQPWKLRNLLWAHRFDINLCFLCLFFSAIFSDILTYWLDGALKGNYEAGSVHYILWFVFLLILTAIFFILFRRFLSLISVNEKLLLTLILYASLIFSFAGYYSMYYAISDYNFQIAVMGTEWPPNLGDADSVRAESKLAFKGINSRLWNITSDSTAGQNNSARVKITRKWYTFPPQLIGSRLWHITLDPTKQVNIARNWEILPPQFLDCLYFSVVTTATVGYGDITPRHQFIKMAAMLQAFLSVVLVFIIGTFLSSKEEGRTSTFCVRVGKKR